MRLQAMTQAIDHDNLSKFETPNPSILSSIRMLGNITCESFRTGIVPWMVLRFLTRFLARHIREWWSSWRCELESRLVSNPGVRSGLWLSNCCVPVTILIIQLLWKPINKICYTSWCLLDSTKHEAKIIFTHLLDCIVLRPSYKFVPYKDTYTNLFSFRVWL